MPFLINLKSFPIDSNVNYYQARAMFMQWMTFPISRFDRRKSMCTLNQQQQQPRTATQLCDYNNKQKSIEKSKKIMHFRIVSSILWVLYAVAKPCDEPMNVTGKRKKRYCNYVCWTLSTADKTKLNLIFML